VRPVRWSRGAGGAGFGGGEEAGDERAGWPGGQERVAGGDGADAGEEFVGADVLAEEPLAPARRARATYSSISKVVRMRRGRGQVGVVADGRGGGEAVGSGHADVHDDDVGWWSG